MIKKNTLPHELVGKEIVVIDSTNLCEKGISGKIIDETKQTLKVQQAGEIKTLLKKNITFKLDENAIVRGKDLTKRPEERLKS